MTPRIPVASMLIFAACCLTAAALSGQRADPFGDTATDLVREPAIGYFTTAASDPVARLKARVESGEVTLRFDPQLGYLRDVLDALRLAADSQVLAYSKTSVQSAHITPRNPRALYFSDAVSVGYIRNAPFIEFAAQDPRQGIIFYTLDQTAAGRPTIERRDFCLQCHNAFATNSVPGMLDRSVVTAANGNTLPMFGNYVTDHRSPLPERWGGYYVTGTHGGVRHLGNALVDRTDPEAASAAAQNVTSLERAFDASAYLSPHSDIAALLVFDHQMRMMNLLTRVGWEIRLAAAQHADVAARARELALGLVDYMLFVDEAPLPDKITGTTTFAAAFSARPPADHKGRSLRQLALSTRLMRYPCSYMIYSEAFDALPAEARDAVYRRLWEVLSGAEHGSRYARLTVDDRRAIIEILAETKKDLPAYFH